MNLLYEKQMNSGQNGEIHFFHNHAETWGSKRAAEL